MWLLTSPADRASPKTVTQRFSLIIRGVIEAVLGHTHPAFIQHPLSQAINDRVIRIGLKVRDLIEALRAGTLRTRKSPAPGVKRKPRSPPAEGAIRLPRKFGWLRPLVPTQAVNLGSQLDHLFKDPEMAGYLAACPRLVNTLKPMCRMLGIRMAPEYLPPPVPRKPRKPRPPRPCDVLFPQRPLMGQWGDPPVMMSMKMLKWRR